jgi:hypothetical protein
MTISCSFSRRPRRRGGLLNIVMCDASVISVPRDVDEKELRKAIPPADGQIGDLLPKRDKNR